MSEKLIAIVADVQVGHMAALWPDGFTFGEGAALFSIKLAPHQEILLDYWRRFWTSPEAQDAEYVINLAESIEGKNKKEFGAHLLTANLDIQEDAFVALLQPYIAGKQYFGLKGSGYHNSDDKLCELSIAEKLGGKFKGDIANLKIQETGHVIWATHKGGDAMLYRSTMLDRNSLYFSAIKSRLSEDPEIIVYGHHHKYFRVDTESRISLIAPTWKFWHPIKGAAKFPYTQPTIGGLVLRLPPEKGEIRVIKKFYPLQHLYSALEAV